MSNRGNDRFDDDSEEEYANGENGSSRWSVSEGLSSSSEESPEASATPVSKPPEGSGSEAPTEPSVAAELNTQSIQNQLDPDLVEYLLQHRDDISLDFIRLTHELLSEMKRSSQSNKSIHEHFSDLKRKYYAPDRSVVSESDTCEELASVQQANERLELKLRLLEKRYEEEMSYSKELKVDDIFKNSGAADYVESNRKTIKAKNDTIADLKTEMDRLKKDVTILREQCTRASRLSDQYRQRLRDYETAQVRPVTNMHMSREHSMNLERMVQQASPAPSYDAENRISPPPPVEVPSIDEMLGSVNSPAPLSLSRQTNLFHDSRHFSSANSSQHNSLNMLDNSIPPPPNNVDFDEIFKNITYGTQQSQNQAPPHSQSMNSMYNNFQS